MPFNFLNLDDETRRFMVSEIEKALDDGQVYFSKRFNEAGYAKWPELLLEAARKHDEHWLAYQLETQGLMKGIEESRTPSGGYTVKHVPHTAAETMAEGQFNRFYILGLCHRALAEGVDEVIIYRAKDVSQPRSESERIVGETRDPKELIEQLWTVESSFRSELVKPNSGLSVHL